MCLAVSQECICMKSIKITDLAHKGLQLLAANVDDIQQGAWASTVIIEQLETEWPEVYQQLRAWAIRNERADDLEAITSNHEGGDR